MRHSLKITALFLLMAALTSALGDCKPGSEAARKESMKNEAAVPQDVVRPPIDRERPVRIETATFALG